MSMMTKALLGAVGGIGGGPMASDAQPGFLGRVAGAAPTPTRAGIEPHWLRAAGATAAGSPGAAAPAATEPASLAALARSISGTGPQLSMLDMMRRLLAAGGAQAPAAGPGGGPAGSAAPGPGRYPFGPGMASPWWLGGM